MKRIVTFWLLLMTLGICAQPYNNEWIDFSKTYYRFKIGADGLYRIPQSVIAGLGLSNTPVQNFQLFRKGQEIPIYTSASSGILGASDYIEFWGQMNDGKEDKALYRNPASQHTDKLSLQTDTAAYFLTVNPSGSTFHYTTINNDTTGNILPVEPYFMNKIGTYFRSQINPGYAQVVGEYVYSSVYDVGEFWSSAFIGQFAPLTDNLNNLFVYNSGPNPSLAFGAVGCADTLRHLQIKVNGTLVKDTAMNSFNDVLSSASFPLSVINGSSAAVQFINNSQANSFTDRIVASFYELTYPRQFNFGGSSNFYFELPARVSGYFLKITGFNQGSAVPVLYDMATGERYVAVTAPGNNFYFQLQGSAGTRKMVMVSQDPSNISTVTNLTSRNFINFNDPINQGNYLIISNPSLYTGSSGNNPVNDYRDYRNTPAGGGFNSLVVDINELVDQFAFGTKKHPSSVKNFLNFARNKFSVKPAFVFLIGRGMAYNDYRLNESNTGDDILNPVPTFGYPASDAMLSSADGAHPIPLTPIGRIAAISGQEVEIYLAKIKEYDQVQQTAPNTIAGRDWMKSVVHVTGATDPYLEAVLCNYMNAYKQVIIDTLFGANVTTFCSTSTSQDDQISGQLFPTLFSNGISVMTYFGHSSISNLGFNLDDPSIYNNKGKYPVFYVNGCYAGNFFTYDPARLTTGKTLSENYIFSKDKGSIAFVASTHFGIVNYLNVLLSQLYDYMNHQDYGKPIGVLQADAAQSLVNLLPSDYFARLHAEEMTIHGDPALKINVSSLPDYDIESSQIKISPAFISVANNSFIVNARFVNLGKAVPDSISILITRKYPDGSSSSQKIRIPGIFYSDSLQLTFPIVATRDKGLNSITITVNSDNNVSEVTLLNNTVTTSVFIYEDELSPIYPYNYAIVSNSTQHLFASTANPFSPSQQYVMQIDTTELFNSPVMVSKNITSIGGVFEFDPGFSYKDSTVYYWRTSIVPAQGGQYHWNEFSFVYLSNSTQGFNQSHYYQHLQSTPQSVNLLADRQWHYGSHLNNLYITQSIFPTGSKLTSDFAVSVNGQSIIASACLGFSLIFNVFDPVTFKPWKNVDGSGNNLYLSGSAAANCAPNRNYNFEFSELDAANRNKMMRFMDSIPNGYYVVVRNISASTQAGNTYASDWQADTALFGSNNSLYHRLLAAGFIDIDSFYRPRGWIFVYKKSDLSFAPTSKYTLGIFDKIVLSVDCPSPDITGNFISPKFGPAKQWKQVHWRGASLENPSTDTVSVQVIGIDTLGNQTPLYTLNMANQDFDISSINALQYPYLQLKMTTTDSTHGTPYQIGYWRLNYIPVPEGALAPNIFLSMKDSLDIGDKLEFGIAFKNVSISAFDSMRINLTITDKNNIAHQINLPRRRPIVSGDTLKIAYEIDTKGYPGLNTLFLDVNPNNDQPEQFHFNNFLYHNFYVKVDQTNPLLDVTFDNVHILNEDIVSAKPHIMIKLKDESKFLLLNDTSVLKVQLRYPDGSLHPYYFNTDTVRFTPATNGADNAATVDFFPAFTKQFNPEGDEYQLIVTGKDETGNPAGTIQYQVTFKVITKAMISNMLNYPNPFTTSTAFVFTITGSDVPQNIKIQILTITGKIVREITKDELGPLHVGRNITEFKWDGTDMYHQRLANGVYLYHVVTNLNGKSLDKYKAEGDNTDQYFTKGYGKMYLMR